MPQHDSGDRKRSLHSCKMTASVILFTSLLCMPLQAALTNPMPGNAAGFEIDNDDTTLHSGNGLAGGAGINGDDWAQGASGSGVLNSDGSQSVPFSTHFVDQNWGNAGPWGGADATQFRGASNTNADLIDLANDPYEWSGIGGGPQKNDLTNVYLHLRTDAEGDQWMIFGAETRSDDGTSHVDFTFLQAGILQTGATSGMLIGLGPDGGRTDGDFIASVDLENGGTAIIPGFRIWDGGTNAYVVQDLTAAATADALFITSNRLPIQHPAAVSPWHHYQLDGAISPNGTIVANQLVEFALNLTHFGLAVDPCDPGASVITKSRSSASFTAQLKDFSLGQPFGAALEECMIVGPEEVCPGTEGITYSVAELAPTGDELVAFLLGRTARERHMDVNLDGVITIADLVDCIEYEAAVGAGQAGLPPGSSIQWTIEGDATFCDGTTTATGMEVCVNAGDAGCNGSFLLTATTEVNTECGTAVCALEVVVGDTTPPVISCPPDLTVNCDDDFDAGVATATDSCDPDPIVDLMRVDSNGDCPEVITRVFRAIDACGNIATCEQTITIVDTEPPVLADCPPDITLDCDDEIPNPSFMKPTDNCDNLVSLTISERLMDGDCLESFICVRTYIAEDRCGNVASCEQIITVVDSTPPVIDCPDDLTIDCDDDIPLAFATAEDNCDPFPEVELVSEISSGECPIVITRVFEATDDCGNTSRCAQTITIEDTTPPVIDCPDDVVMECDDDLDSVVPTATDNCDESPLLALVSERVAGECPTVITRVFQATDACGNTATCEQTITLVDETPPVLAGCPSDESIECDEQLPAPANVTATDNCDDTVAVTLSTEIIAGNCPEEMIVVRTWTATDDCGNASRCQQTITVADTTPPVIDCPADVTFGCDELVIFAEPTVSDNCDASPEVLQAISDVQGDCADEQILTVLYTAIDNCGNVATCEQVIRIVDEVPPVFTDCPPDITIECDEPIPAADPIAIDECDPDPDVFMNETRESDGCTTIITRTFTAVDVCGNVATCEQVITQVDTTPPVIDCPADVTFECVSGEIVAATASDNCAQIVIVTFTDEVEDDGCTQITTRTWTADDGCGNTASCIQTITVTDTTPPVIDCPADVTVECDEDILGASATATDLCDPDPAVTLISELVQGECPLVITRVFQATDACGNVATCEQTITVIDSTPPEIDCPADVTVECDEDIPGAGATATDNCDQQVNVILVSENATGSCPTVITRVYEATDDCGNTARCTQTITVVDTTPPVISCPPDLTVECGDPFDAGQATATDNCDPNPFVKLASESSEGTCPTIITRVFRAVDVCGNVATCEQTITIVDTTPPEIECPADITLDCVDSMPPVPQIQATDNCDPFVTVTFEEIIFPGTCPNEFVCTRNWTATDDCGNTATCVQTVTISDQEAPVVDCPDDVVTEPGETVRITITATDNCSGSIAIDSDFASSTGGVFGLVEVTNGVYDITVPTDGMIVTGTITATDVCGNTSDVCVFTVQADAN